MTCGGNKIYRICVHIDIHTCTHVYLYVYTRFQWDMGKAIFNCWLVIPLKATVDVNKAICEKECWG